MTIIALPPSTINAIGSTQALSDSASVVKELVDNALDAGASTIFVETAVNGIDVIQVRDNGHGIAPEDRALVFRRHCTSKISDLDDLETIGGTCLGFRGEALAGVAEMSGGIVLTTKIVGEPVATSLKISRQGEILSQDHISHPVGTTIRVSDFLKYLPVRKQAALKSPSKTNSSIKTVLQTYAIARPTVRFSLKELKAKNEKGKWTYAPKTNASMLDAATQTLNSAAISQCKLHLWKPPISPCEISAPIPANDPQSGVPNFSIEALLPSPGCNISLISQVGQYIAVDSRPLSSTRGVGRQVVSLFKSYLRTSCVTEEKIRLIEPILCMNIICPQGSYDPNIEPAKDDVLFTNSGEFLFMVECFFKHIYRADGLGMCVSENSGQRLEGRPIMYGIDSDDMFNVQCSEQPTEGDSFQAVRNTSNPWSIAKMNSLVRPSSIHDDDNNMIRFNGQLMTPAKQAGDVRKTIYLPSSGPELSKTFNGQLMTPAKQAGDLRETTYLPSSGPELSKTFNGNALPTPQRSKPEISPSDRGTSSSPDHFTFPQRAWRSSTQDKSSNGPRQIPQDKFSGGALDKWIEKSSPAGLVSAQRLSVGTPLGSIPDCSERPRRSSTKENNSQHHDPVEVSPVNDPQNVWFNFGQKYKSKSPTKSRPQLDFASIPQLRPDSEDEHATSAGVSAPMANVIHPDLAITLDYETRKQVATLRQRESIRRQARLQEEGLETGETNSSGATTISSPHQNRYRKALAALGSTKDESLFQLPAFPNGDPRAYLLRLQKLAGPQQSTPVDEVATFKLKRRKTTMLPLETIPTNDTMHHIVLTLNPSQKTIHHLTKKLNDCDEYIKTGKQDLNAFTSITTLEDSQLLGTSLQNLLSKAFQMDPEGSAAISLNLGMILQDRQTTVDASENNVQYISD